MLYQNMRRFALNNFPRNQFVSNHTWVRIPPAAPTCIDKKDADKNPALRCGIFAYKIKNSKQLRTISSHLKNRGA